MKPARGFTLTEIAIALLIISLLIAFSLSSLSTLQEVKQRATTMTTLAAAQEAITGFVIQNGHLPCPADPTAADGSTAAGIEARQPAGTCTLTAGVLPWATLGVEGIDAWGRRLTYKVAASMADTSSTTLESPAQYPACTTAPALTTVSFSRCSRGDIAAWAVDAAGAESQGATSLPYVLISHGKNGYGGYLNNVKLDTANATATEVVNAGDVSATVNVEPSRSCALLPTSCISQRKVDVSEEMDDIVALGNPFLLLTNMIRAGRLP